MPAPIRRRVRHLRDELDRRRRPRWGNFRRDRPFSAQWGFDRGTPVDRYYLNRFFDAHRADIAGRVLEVKHPMFTRAFGTNVTHIDVVDILPTNTEATVVADLSERGSLPAASWDCIVLPQTLQFVDDVQAAIANSWEALRPGGVLLVTVPALSRVDASLGDLDRWRLLPTGLEFALRSACPSGDVTVQGLGSLVTAIAFLHGLAAEELSTEELDRRDPGLALVSCGRVRRP